MIMRSFVGSRLRNAGRRAGDGILFWFHLPLVLLVALTVYGVVSYRNLGGWRLLDALYMTVITVATVGFHEVHPLGPKRQVFCLFLSFS
jgi:hypothetical protein